MVIVLFMWLSLALSGQEKASYEHYRRDEFIPYTIKVGYTELLPVLVVEFKDRNNITIKYYVLDDISWINTKYTGTAKAIWCYSFIELMKAIEEQREIKVYTEYRSRGYRVQSQILEKK